VVALFSHIVFPIATIAFLLHVRRKCSVRTYLISCVAIVAAALLLWFLKPVLYDYYKGPLDSAGFDTWTVPIAAFSVAAICWFAVQNGTFEYSNFSPPLLWQTF
jgi:hypothetical protein